MAAEDQTSQPDTEARDALPWWDVRHPRTLHLYVGLCWAFTPLALANLHELLGQHLDVGLRVAAVVWVVGHVALISCVLRLHLIQRPLGGVLFGAAIVAASAGIWGIALLIVIPETLSTSDLKLVSTLPQLYICALPLLSLSATYSSPQPPTPQT